MKVVCQASAYLVYARSALYLAAKYIKLLNDTFSSISLLQSKKARAVEARARDTEEITREDCMLPSLEYRV